MNKKEKKCRVCGKDSGKKITCSNACKQKYYYQKQSEENTYHYQYKRAIERKLYLVNLRGGKCQRCPYDKNISALEFHHINPKEKKFQLDLRTIGNKSFDLILKEFEKCELLCANCHREYHHPELSKEKTSLIIIDYNLQRLKREKTNKPKCLDCGTEINYTYKRCVDCNNFQKRKLKNRPSNQEINEMRLKYSLEEIALKFQVSRRTISRWLSKLN